MAKNLYDIAAEAGIIGTLLKTPEYALHTEWLKPAHFYNIENACLYWIITELLKKGITNIDAFNIQEIANKNAKTKEIIGKMNIQTIQDLLEKYLYVARTSLEEYKILANRVMALSYKRELSNKLKILLKQEVENEDIDNIGQIYQSLYREIDSLMKDYSITDDIKPLGEIIDKLWKDIQKRRDQSKKTYGIQSHINELNKYAPFEKGELHIIAAPRKTGKSVFCLSTAVHLMEQNIPTVYIDTEMSTRAFFERLLAHLCRIPVRRIKAGDYTVSEEQLIKNSMDWIKSKPFIHIYQPSWTNEQVYVLCKMLKNKINLQFVIYDYIKGSSTSTSEQYNELGNKTNFLKNNIAGDLDLAVLAGAQLNRHNEMADSYKIEQYASTVLILRPKTDDELQKDGEQCGNYALNVKLNRNGEQMDKDEYIDLVFEGDYATIKQAQKQHESVEPF